MKFTILIIVLSLLAGCGSFSRGCAQMKGHDEVCVSGVAYLQFPSGVSVKYDQNGQIVTCK